MQIITKLRTSLQKRAEYNRIKAELNSMPLETAIDLGIFKEDAARIARETVYG